MAVHGQLSWMLASLFMCGGLATLIILRAPPSDILPLAKVLKLYHGWRGKKDDLISCLHRSDSRAQSEQE